MRNVVIIGSGPAGLTAAVYAARANLSPLLIEGWQSGGQLTTTTEVENYPGFAKGIMGPELMKEMRAQAERFGTEFLTGDVTAVDLKTGPFTLTIDGEQTVQTKTLIIATGATAIQIGVKNEARLTGHGVSTCATCDGFFFKGKELIVVGGGDSCDGGSDLPDQVRDQSLDRPPARQAAGFQNHARPRGEEREDRVRVELRRRRHSGE